MVTISLPDGAKRELPDGANGTLVAEAISKSLAKRAVAMKVDGVLSDLPIASRTGRGWRSSRATTRLRSS